MIKRSCARVAVLLFAYSCMGAAAAENAALMLDFGGDPGSPLAHAYSYGLPETAEPTYTLRIPANDPEIREVFYDTVLTISNPGKIVQAVHASRAYRSVAECEAAQEIIAGKLATALPDAMIGDASWQRRSSDGRVRARAMCEKQRYEPVPVLRFELRFQQ